MEEHNRHAKDFLLEPDKELIELETIREKMEEDIKELWDNVIVSYLNNYRDRQILDKLTIYDYNKFYKWMLYNNNYYQYVCERIRYLLKCL